MHFQPSIGLITSTVARLQLSKEHKSQDINSSSDSAFEEEDRGVISELQKQWLARFLKSKLGTEFKPKFLTMMPVTRYYLVLVSCQTIRKLMNWNWK